MKNEENRTTNFSIDHILNRAGENSCSSFNRFKDSEETNDRGIVDCSEARNELHQNYFHQYTFQWLNCSRYHPPKLTRSFKKESVKRQPGRHPRIPFTSLQIETLEKSYKNSNYLCPDEIVRLSKRLDLSDTRIKIWFQNRRAREKREKESKFNDSNSNRSPRIDDKN